MSLGLPTCPLHLMSRSLRTFIGKKKILARNSSSNTVTDHAISNPSSSSSSSNRHQSQVNFDTLGTWDNRIELPLLLPESIRHGKPIPKISVDNVGFASLTGRRNTNEDRFKVQEVAPELLYLAVYDGHGGHGCAEYCNNHMEDHILYWLDRGETDLSNILLTSFIEVNNAFARYVAYNMPNADNASSGTTATVCLLRNSVELVVGHVGDSRALLCRNGEARKLTTDHCPQLKKEKERIEKSGGRVLTNSVGASLVNGRLAMTRSLGDLGLKQYGVISLPDIRTLEVKHGRDAFLVLTTDGINFVMSDQEICDTINRCSEPHEAAHFIADQALQYASDDNATAVVIPFSSWGKFNSSKAASYSLGRNMMKSSRYN